MTPTRPKPFSESERGQVERIKRIAAAEAAEAERMALAALWEEYRAGDWIAEAFETRDHIRQQQELNRLKDELRYEVVISDIEG